MKTNPTRGFAPILAIILALIIIGGGVYLYQHNQKKVAGPTATITILSPKAGDVWKIGEKHIIELDQPLVSAMEGRFVIRLISQSGHTDIIQCLNIDPTTPKLKFEWDGHSLEPACGTSVGYVPVATPGQYQIIIDRDDLKSIAESRYFTLVK